MEIYHCVFLFDSFHHKQFYKELGVNQVHMCSISSLIQSNALKHKL